MTFWWYTNINNFFGQGSVAFACGILILMLLGSGLKVLRCGRWHVSIVTGNVHQFCCEVLNPIKTFHNVSWVYFSCRIKYNKNVKSECLNWAEKSCISNYLKYSYKDKCRVLWSFQQQAECIMFHRGGSTSQAGWLWCR